MIRETWCKSALTISKLPGIEYSLNPYVGCQHACVYCYVPSVMHLKRDEWGKTVHAKVNIPSVLQKEIKKRSRGIVGISTSTDAYQPAEKRYELTRKCLMVLARHDWPVDILTKSDLVLRDIDILARLSDVRVGFTIPTLNDKSRRLLEPHAPSIERRLSALRECGENGLRTYVFCGPLFPDVEKEGVKNCVDVFIDAGAEEIIIDSFHLKRGIWESMASVIPDEEKMIFEERIRGAVKLFSEFERHCRGRITLTRAFA